MLLLPAFCGGQRPGAVRADPAAAAAAAAEVGANGPLWLVEVPMALPLPLAGTPRPLLAVRDAGVNAVEPRPWFTLSKEPKCGCMNGSPSEAARTRVARAPELRSALE